jgi:hypothetical protein
MLRRLLAKRGRLSQRMIARQKNMPCVCDFVARFGSLFNAYRMIGYCGTSKYPACQERLKRRHLRVVVMEGIRSITESAGLRFQVGTTVNVLAAADDMPRGAQTN